jgi:hypothetical protein
MPTTEQLLFFLCAVLALTPLLVISLLLSRLSGEGTLRVELAERGVARLTRERDEARAVAESLRSGSGRPAPTPAPVASVTPPVSQQQRLVTVAAGPEVKVTETLFSLDSPNGNSAVDVAAGLGTSFATTPSKPDEKKLGR